MKGENHPICNPPVIVVSGGTGASGTHVVNTVLAQFPHSEVPVVTVNHVREAGQVEEVLRRAGHSGGIIVHTLVDTGLRGVLKERARQRGIPAIDLMGDLMEWLAGVLGEEPVCRPGLYRSLNRTSIERAEAIGFAVAHDDGQNLHELSEAQIVLVGLSRVGKTPLSMYLAVQGWKTANVPIVSHGLPREVDRIDQGRVIGLTLDADRLFAYRRIRREKLGMKDGGGYADLKAVFDESEQARELFRKKGYAFIDVTDKALETIADEVVRIIVRRFGSRVDDSLVCALPGGKMPVKDMKEKRPGEENGRHALETSIEKALEGIPYERKKMFGCPAFFAHGVMFAGVYRNSVFVRLDEKDRARLAGLSPHIQPFEPLPGRVMSQYMSIPDVLCAQESFLKEWLNRSYAYAMSLPPGKERATRTRKKRR